MLVLDASSALPTILPEALACAAPDCGVGVKVPPSPDCRNSSPVKDDNGIPATSTVLPLEKFPWTWPLGPIEMFCSVPWSVGNVALLNCRSCGVPPAAPVEDAGVPI